MVKELSKILTGTKISNWKNETFPPIIAFSMCDCHKYAAIGTWKEGKREGMDTISNQGENKDSGKIGKYATRSKGIFVPHKKDKYNFNYAEKIAEGKLSCINSEIIFEEGLVTVSQTIQGELDKKYEFYTFFMDLSLEKCIENYKNRGSIIKEDISIPKIEEKWKDAIKIFDKLQVKNKFKLSGTIQENVQKVIEVANLQSCLCMKNMVIQPIVEPIKSVQTVVEIKKELPKRRTSLFD
jgi:hypothetical protein